MGGFSQTWIDFLYRLNAPGYDLANTHRFLEARTWMVEQLGLAPGSTVLDLGCGTGANLDLLSEAVGPEGLVIGLEWGAPMLAKAEKRVESKGLHNVRLAQADARELDQEQLDEAAGRPVSLDAGVATLLFSVVPDYESVFRRLWGLVRPGGVCGILDGYPREGLAGWLTTLEDWLAAADQRRPTWELLDQAGARTRQEHFGRGAFHVTVGHKVAGEPAGRTPPSPDTLGR